MGMHECQDMIQHTATLPCFCPIFKTRFLVQTLISQPNINQIKRFVDQNLSWLMVNRKQFQFWKSKILFSCYSPLNSEPFVYSPGRPYKYELESHLIGLLDIKQHLAASGQQRLW